MRQFGRLAAMTLLAAFATLAQARDAASNDIRDVLVPVMYINGGPSTAASALPGQGANGPFVKLVYPSAVAAFGPDLYVADSGLGALLRIDTLSQAIARLAVIPPTPNVRLKSGPDGTLYVVRPDRSTVDRITREGARLAAFSAPFDILQPADVVIDRRLNAPWIADSAGGVFSFHPSGRKSHALAGRGDGFAAPGTGAILLAAGARSVIGIDAGCRCILEFDIDGTILDRYGLDQLLAPSAIAVDANDRVWVIDRGDRKLKIFHDGQLAYSAPAGQLGLMDMTSIAIDVFRAYIADGTGGKIGVFSILAP